MKLIHSRGFKILKFSIHSPLYGPLVWQNVFIFIKPRDEMHSSSMIRAYMAWLRRSSDFFSLFSFMFKSIEEWNLRIKDHMSFLAHSLNTNTNSLCWSPLVFGQYFFIVTLLSCGCGYFVRTNVYLVENQSLQARWLIF